tara:strand:- start:336 stop:629 length:294 start_codon:yes stop_codon:yes gene_type:complete
MKSKSSTLTSCSRCDRWSKESQKQSVAKGENEGTSSSSTAPLSGSWPVLDVKFHSATYCSAPVEVLSRTAHSAILEEAHHAIGILRQHRWVIVGRFK